MSKLTLEQVVHLYKGLKASDALGTRLFNSEESEYYDWSDRFAEEFGASHSKLIEKLYEDTLAKVDGKMRYVLEVLVDNDGYLNMWEMLYQINVFYTKFCNESIMTVLNGKQYGDTVSEIVAKQSDSMQEMLCYIEHAEEDALLVCEGRGTKDQDMNSVVAYLESAVEVAKLKALSRVPNKYLLKKLELLVDLNHEFCALAENPEFIDKVNYDEVDNLFKEFIQDLIKLFKEDPANILNLILR